MDTIIALSSGALPAGVAVVRVSGPGAADITQRLVGTLPKPRFAYLSDIRGSDGLVIDQGLCLWFPGPNSFTGEDVAEFQLHGSRAVVNHVLDYCCSIDGVRLAEPGEFARMAFANGKFDLTAAEGLADLLEAETEAQRKVAHYLASGALKDLYNGWQDRLLDARALVEADIDFADEDDVPGSVADKVWHDMADLRSEIVAHLSNYKKAEALRDGFKISLIGKPNVGKSSLLNALAGSDRAIVSPEAGTTRDVVEVRLDLGGYLVLLRDTAGIRDGAGPVEQQGIQRSFRAVADSDLVLHLSDCSDWSGVDVDVSIPRVRVLSKADNETESADSDVSVSVLSSRSIDRFSAYLTKRVGDSLPDSSADAGLRGRYIGHLKSAAQELDAALKENDDLEFRVEHLRAAAYRLGVITGQHDVEDVLGRIFSSFCIGK